MSFKEQIKVIDIKTNQVVIPDLQDRILNNLVQSFQVQTKLNFFQALLDVFNDPNLDIVPKSRVYEGLDCHFRKLWRVLSAMKKPIDNENNVFVLDMSKIIFSLVKIHKNVDCAKAVKYAQKHLELLFITSGGVLSALFKTFGDIFLDVESLLSPVEQTQFLSSLLQLQSRIVANLVKPCYFENLCCASAALFKHTGQEFQATKILQTGFYSLFPYPDFIMLVTQAETLLKFHCHLPAFKIDLLENMIFCWPNHKVGNRSILIEMVFTLGKLYYEAENLDKCQHYLLLYCRLITEIIISEHTNPSNLRKVLNHAFEMAKMMNQCYVNPFIDNHALETFVYGSELLVNDLAIQAKHYRSLNEHEKSCDCINAIIVMCHTTLITSGPLQIQMWSLFYNLAISFMNLKRYFEALDVLELASTIEPNSKDLLFYEIQGYCYQEIKYHEEAEQAYVLALLKAIDEPSKASIYAKIGLNFYATGDLHKAKINFEAALKNRKGYKLLDFEKNVSQLLVHIYAFENDEEKQEKMAEKIRQSGYCDTKDNTLHVGRQCLWKKDFKLAKIWFKIGNLPAQHKNEAYLSQLVSCINLNEEVDTGMVIQDWRNTFCTLSIFLYNVKETFKIPTMKQWIKWDFLHNTIGKTDELSISKNDFRRFRNSCAIYEQICNKS